jgi:hypothetical protein
MVAMIEAAARRPSQTLRLDPASPGGAHESPARGEAPSADPFEPSDASTMGCRRAFGRTRRFGGSGPPDGAALTGRGLRDFTALAPVSKDGRRDRERRR